MEIGNWRIEIRNSKLENRNSGLETISSPAQPSGEFRSSNFEFRPWVNRQSKLGNRQSAIALLLVFLATLVSVAAPSGFGQTKPLERRPEKPSAAVDESGLVKLWVVAIARPHTLIQNLTRKDFHIYEDKQEQEIVRFAYMPREPLRLGVLLDMSLNRDIDQPDALAPAPISKFLRATLGKDDRAFVAVFNDSVSFLCPWTAKPEELDDALKRGFNTELDGPANLYDAIYTLCEERFSSEPGRKALIVLSDSPDENSSHTELEALEIAHRSDTIIYPVMPWERTLSAPLFKNVAFAQTFANDTGGFFYFVIKPEDLGKTLKGIGTVVTHFYELAFRPDVSPHDGKYHKIKVTCSRHGIKLYTREGYYAPKS
ncbi:MAG: VWA domain-containing protein [Terriglobia bacterium]